MPMWTDPEFLLRHQYGTPDNLRARMDLHERFGPAADSWFRWLYDFVPAGDAIAVLEVGCGPGRLWHENLERLPARWSLTLTDLSPGMVAAAETALGGWTGSARCLVADAQALPFADASFDVAVANHMLYHLPDLAAGVAELHRVLRPGGSLIAATNGEGHMGEVNALPRDALPAEVVAAVGLAPRSLGFRLENGAAALKPPFATVERCDRPSELRVTEVEPLIAYVASTTRTHAAAALLGRERIDTGLSAVARAVAAAIARDGAFRIGRASGVFVAVKSGAGRGERARG